MPQAVSGSLQFDDVHVNVAQNESDREFVNEDDTFEIKH